MRFLMARHHSQHEDNFISLFPNSHLTVIGDSRNWKGEPIGETLMTYADRITRKTVRIEDEVVTPDNYDLLIDVVEAYGCYNNYLKVAEKWNIPRVYKACWFSSPPDPDYYQRVGDYPIVFETEINLARWVRRRWWRTHRVQNARVIRNTALPFEDKDYAGDIPKLICSCNGYFSWRPSIDSGKDIVELCKKQLGPDIADLHDGYVKTLPTRELTDKFRHRRVFLEGTRIRPLSRVWMEGMILGMPTISCASENLEYRKFIQHGVNGFLFKKEKEVPNLVKTLLDDYDLAKEIGKEAKKTAKANFYSSVVRPQWEQTFKEALEYHNVRVNDRVI